MTKRRPPLTFERALMQIAAQIGWEAAAAIVGKSSNAIRNWSDSDTSASIRMDDALKLDLAFREAGGDGAPLLQCYATRLEVDTATVLHDTSALHQKIARAAREGGEAIEHTLLAALPGASDAQYARAELELEESIASQTNALAALRSVRMGLASSEGEARAPEVAQQPT